MNALDFLGDGRILEMDKQYEHPGAYIVDGPQEWQIFQRKADGTAEIDLSGVSNSEPTHAVQVRVVREDTNRPPCEACDWHDVESTGPNAWKTTLSDRRKEPGGEETVLGRCWRGRIPGGRDAHR